MLQGEIKPRFEVEELEGTVTVTRWRRCLERNMNVCEDVEEPAGYMVYFPSGHSIRIATHEELMRQGFARSPDLVDMESGESAGVTQHLSLKEHVRRRAGPSKRRADTSAISVNQGD